MKKLIGLFFLLSLSANVLAQPLLSDSIPYPFYEKQTDGQNKLMPINDGQAALQLRLDMIRRAEKTIEVEYFIYELNKSARVFTHELINAVKRGVKVRILIDKSIAVFEFKEPYAKYLAKLGIEVRYYNAAPAIDLSSSQFRSHRKLLVIDDKEAITGGRNIGDDYFDLSSKFNFNDTDVYVQGPIAKTMRESFDKYYEHKISQRPRLNDLVEVTDEVEKFFKESDEDIALTKKLDEHGKKYFAENKMYVCPETTYVTDAPGANVLNRLDPDFTMDYKFVRKALYDKLVRVDKKVLLSSPYMIGNKHSMRLMNQLLKNDVQITLYTNSLASTDAIYVASNLYFEVFKWIKRGIVVYLHDGRYVPINPDLDPEIKAAKWGTHTKAQVYESTHGTEAMIGTYNIDNRSNFYNSEMAIFCKGNDEYTQKVKDQIMFMANKGIKVNANGSATDREGNLKSVFGSDEKDVTLMKVIFLPSWLLKFLL